MSGGSKISELLNRPASSSSAGTTGSSGSGLSVPSNASTSNTSQASSSLAHAFGGERPSTSDGQPHPQMSSQPMQMQMQGQDAYGGSSYRPSFKRIASQTLGPDNAKRALLGPAGWDHDEEDEDAVEEDEEDGDNTRTSMSGSGAEARRMSLPTQG